MSNQQQTAGNWLAPGVLVAVAPFAGYLLVYVREWAYALYFDIPKEFIAVSLSSALGAAVGFLLFAFLLFWVLDLTFSVFGVRGKNILYTRFTSLGFFVLLLLAEVLIFGWKNWEWWLLFALLPALYILVFVVLAFAGGREAKTWQDKLHAQDARDLKAHTLADELVARLGSRLAGIFVLIIVGLIIAGSLGIGEALHQTQYLVPEDAPNVAVLRIYGDTAVGVRFERATRKTSEQFVVWKVGDRHNVLQRERIGPLKP